MVYDNFSLQIRVRIKKCFAVIFGGSPPERCPLILYLRRISCDRLYDLKNLALLEFGAGAYTVGSILRGFDQRFRLNRLASHRGISGEPRLGARTTRRKLLERLGKLGRPVAENRQAFCNSFAGCL